MPEQGRVACGGCIPEAIPGAAPVEAIADEAVSLLRTYRLSHGLLIPDALIAATALTENLPLVSKNQRDYRFIANLQLLPYPPKFR